MKIIIVCCNAQSYTLKGSVKDAATGESLIGASVRSVVNQRHGAVTDIHGAFELLISSEDTIRITFIGFEEEKIPVRDVSNLTVEIKLKAITNTFEAVEIKEHRIISEEFSIHKFGKLDIYTNPSAKADPLLAVNSTPSATPIDESANISLRGGSPAETGIFFNSVPINDAIRYSQLNGIGTFSIFNTALIKDVQVYPGNPPLEFGNSTSGIIALETDEVIPGKSNNSVSLSLANAGFYSSRKLSGKSSLTLFANYQPSEIIRTLNYRALKDVKKFSAADMGLHYFIKLSHRATIKIFNYTLRESYQFHLSQPTYQGIFRQGKFRNFTVCNFRKRIRKTEMSYNQGIIFSNADYNYGSTEINIKQKDFFSSFNIHHIDTMAEWKTGLSYYRKSADFVGTFPTYEFASGENHPVSYAKSRDLISNPEWYGYYKRYIRSRWIAGGGVRKNIPVMHLDGYLSFQGNLHYKPKETWNINLSAGKYHKYQIPEGRGSDAFLIRCNQYSLDVNYSSAEKHYSLSLFHKRGALQERITNVKGIELFTRYHVKRNMKFQFSFTCLDAKETRNQTVIPSPYNIHYFVRGNLEYKFMDTWTINTVFLFRQGSYYYSVREANYNNWLNVYEPIYELTPNRLPAYNSVELSISKIFLLADKITSIAFLSANNVLNLKNIRSYTYNFDYTIRKEYLFSQRTLYFGLIVNF